MLLEILVLGTGLDLDHAVYDAIHNAAVFETRVAVKTKTQVSNGEITDNFTVNAHGFHKIDCFEVKQIFEDNGLYKVRVLVRVHSELIPEDWSYTE